MDHQPLTSDEFAARYSGESDVLEFKQGVSEHKIAEAVTAFFLQELVASGDLIQREQRRGTRYLRPGMTE